MGEKLSYESRNFCTAGDDTLFILLLFIYYLIITLFIIYYDTLTRDPYRSIDIVSKAAIVIFLPFRFFWILNIHLPLSFIEECLLNFRFAHSFSADI